VNKLALILGWMVFGYAFCRIGFHLVVWGRWKFLKLFGREKGCENCKYYGFDSKCWQENKLGGHYGDTLYYTKRPNCPGWR
jgi:hypothetical protein